MAAKKVTVDEQSQKKLNASNGETQEKLNPSNEPEPEEDEAEAEPDEEPVSDVVYLSSVTLPVQIAQPWRQSALNSQAVVLGPGIRSIELSRVSSVITVRFTKESGRKPIVLGSWLLAEYLSHGGGPITNKGGRPRGT